MGTQPEDYHSIEYEYKSDGLKMSKQLQMFNDPLKTNSRSGRAGSDMLKTV